MLPDRSDGGQEDAKLIAITGGPGSGKTSLIEHLGALGYATVPEAGIQIIEELNRQHGIPGQIAFRYEHPVEFFHLIIRRQAALEGACAAAKGSLVFCDRGRPDSLAYAELYDLPIDAELQSHAASQCTRLVEYQSTAMPLSIHSW